MLSQPTGISTLYNFAQALVEWVAAIQEEKDLEPITAFSDLVTYDDDGDLPLVSFLQLVYVLAVSLKCPLAAPEFDACAEMKRRLRL